MCVRFLFEWLFLVDALFIVVLAFLLNCLQLLRWQLLLLAWVCVVHPLHLSFGVDRGLGPACSKRLANHTDEVR